MSLVAAKSLLQSLGQARDVSHNAESIGQTPGTASVAQKSFQHFRLCEKRFRSRILFQKFGITFKDPTPFIHEIHNAPVSSKINHSTLLLGLDVKRLRQKKRRPEASFSRLNSEQGSISLTIPP
jgi:hypothetical protein